MIVQDISTLFLLESNFTENHFISCTRGGGAILFAVGIYFDHFQL